VRAPILGWDVGGANLKLARLEGGGLDALRVVERPFALWREPSRLPEELRSAAASLGAADRMAVTMTAELADCFATKREGVAFVLEAFARAFPGVRPRVYGVDGRFMSVEAARRRPLRAAASNWMASAAFLAPSFPDALLLDVGSTTTDVVPIVGGRVVARGRTDPGRLRSGELVYTGALRTPVCAIARSLPLRGGRCRAAAEVFAVAADAHLWLGHIGEAEYTCETPDGRGRDRRAAGGRLARMVCADLDGLTDADVTGIAEHVARSQVNSIAGGLAQVMRRLGPACPRSAVLLGLGTFLGRAAAEARGLAVVDGAVRLGAAAARATPAAAVAFLLARQEDP
jgi:probable H4MPT-linked C1 transfer pathway protein